MNDDLVSKAIDAYENEPGVMQFPAMYSAGKVFESFYKAEIELLRTEVKGLSQCLIDCLECEKDYLSEISELRAEVDGLRGEMRRIYMRATRHPDDDYADCKRNLYHIESIAKGAMGASG